MNVAEFAKDLGLAPSSVIDHCARLGIEATWAGAALTGAEEVRLRRELISEDPPTPRPVTPPLARRPAAVPVGAPDVSDARPAPGRHARGATATDTRPLPPTAVGSIPGFVDDRGVSATDPDVLVPGGGGGGRHARSANGNGLPSVASDMGRRVATVTKPRRFDPALREGVAGLVLAAVALVIGDKVEAAGVTAACWIVAGLLLVISLVCGNRARYRITTHPEQRRGLPVAVAVIVAALLGLAGLGTATWTVMRAAPAAQAPLGLGDVDSVQRLRWGYQRLSVIADHGWQRPAKDPGTCWQQAPPDDDPRRAERVEVGDDHDISCRATHQFEVLEVFAPDRDADSPYPGASELKAAAAERCTAQVKELAPLGALAVEYPTQKGWNAGDHDVACVINAPHAGPLTD